MAEANTAHPVRTESGHELSDLSPRIISFFGVGLAALVIVVLAISYAALLGLRHSAGRRAEPLSPLTIMQEPIPGPRLLVEPESTMKTIRQQEEARLKSYGWIDQESGIVHIPIERAVDMLAEKGLPARPRKAPSSGDRRAAKETGERPVEPVR